MRNEFTVTVFLSTYNGEKYLDEQLQSVFSQKGIKVKLFARDDGSKDETWSILDSLHHRPDTKCYRGQNVGYSRSFMDLVQQPAQTDYYAFCDQDDVWLPDKLSHAVQQIQDAETKYSVRPILYTSALQRVDQDLNFLPKQEFKNLKLTLGAEFTRHRLAGCSFVFNNALRDLLLRAGRLEKVNISHDALTTTLCIACSGKVIFDSNSYILFRRHGNNSSPDGIGIVEKIKKDVLRFARHEHNAPSIANFLLTRYANDLTEESREFLNQIAYYKENWLNTFRLMRSPQIDCGFWFYNLFIRAMILRRWF